MLATQLSRQAYKPLKRVPLEVWLEIAEYISSRSSQSDLVHFGRTSKLLHDISCQILYRDISWAAWTKNNPNTRKTQELSATLNRNPSLYTLVRTIRVNGSVQVQPWYTGVLPLANFMHIQLLELQGTQFEPNLYRTIASLPSLKALMLLVCHPGEEIDFPSEVRTSRSKSLEKLEIYHPMGALSSASYLSLFTRLQSFTLAAPAKESLLSISSLGLASTLTYLRVIIPDDETATILMQFLRATTELEELDLRNSGVETIYIDSQMLPRLHTYRGPPHIAGAFLRGRAVSTVSLIWKSAPFGEYLPSLAETSIPIVNLVIDIQSPWKFEYSKLMIQFTPHLANLVIDCPYVEDLDSWSRNFLPAFQKLRKLRTHARPGQDTEDEEEALIESWGDACPTLQEIDITGSAYLYNISFVRWVRETDGHWTLFRYS